MDDKDDYGDDYKDDYGDDYKDDYGDMTRMTVATMKRMTMATMTRMTMATMTRMTMATMVTTLPSSHTHLQRAVDNTRPLTCGRRKALRCLPTTYAFRVATRCNTRPLTVSL
jgi:hypothetical protein